MEPNTRKRKGKSKRKTTGSSFNWEEDDELDQWASGKAAADTVDVDYAGKMTAGQKRNARLHKLLADTAGSSRTVQQVPEEPDAAPCIVGSRGAEWAVASTGTDESVVRKRDTDLMATGSNTERAAAGGRRQPVTAGGSTVCSRLPVSAVVGRQEREERTCNRQAADRMMQVNQPAEESYQPLSLEPPQESPFFNWREAEILDRWARWFEPGDFLNVVPYLYDMEMQGAGNPGIDQQEQPAADSNRAMNPEDDLAAAWTMDKEHALNTICEQRMTPLTEQEY
ncbi:hypothetical protein LDENG_00259760 [Lucifuga dentata]|nr:hypothetical protein LDENG_00259760 [Lucifuga dentata]